MLRKIGVGRYELMCDICGKSFESSRPNTKVCSVECFNKKKRIQLGRYADVKIPPGSVGTISELVVTVDLMKKGWSVFRAMSPSCNFDLAIFKNGTFKRVEVKTGYKSDSGKIQHPWTTNDNYDILAVYVRIEDKVYYLDKLKESVLI